MYKCLGLCEQWEQAMPTAVIFFFSERISIRKKLVEIENQQDQYFTLLKLCSVVKDSFFHSDYLSFVKKKKMHLTMS